MEVLSRIIVYLPLIATLVIAYLSINKIWKRKHEVSVAQSISLVARGIGIVTNIILLVQAFPSFFLVANFSIWLIVEIILVFIGSGIWVQDGSSKGFWEKVKEALKLEGKESGDLAKSLFQPSNADKLLTILGRLAYIDNHLSNKEKEMLTSFAKDWKVDFDPAQMKHLDEEDHAKSYDLLRRELMDYLKLSPPQQQVSQLADIIQSLIEVDGDVSEKEELIVEELIGLINKYLDNQHETEHYYVAIVPQSKEQESAISSLLAHTEEKKIAGGQAHVSGPFFSKKYSDIVCEKYHELNCLAFVIGDKQVEHQ